MGNPLDVLTRRAGAVLTREHVAAHYGSPAGELSACIRAVGLADRSDLVKLVLTGEPAAVADVVARCSGAELAAGGTAEAAGAWWCARSRDRVVVLAEPGRRQALLAAVEDALAEAPGARLADRSADWTAIALVGRHAADVLSVVGALGADADARLAPPFGRTTVAGIDVELLLQSDRRAVILAEAGRASDVWRRVETAGRGFGLSYAGVEAVSRFSLVDGMLERAPAAALA